MIFISGPLSKLCFPAGKQAGRRAVGRKAGAGATVPEAFWNVRVSVPPRTEAGRRSRIPVAAGHAAMAGAKKQRGLTACFTLLLSISTRRCQCSLQSVTEEASAGGKVRAGTRVHSGILARRKSGISPGRDRSMERLHRGMRARKRLVRACGAGTFSAAFRASSESRAGKAAGPRSGSVFRRQCRKRSARAEATSEALARAQ